MRSIVIQKILWYRSRDGFNPKIMRWSSGTSKRPDNRFRINGIHYSEVDWNDPSVTDEELVAAFEKICLQASKQM